MATKMPATSKFKGILAQIKQTIGESLSPALMEAVQEL